MFQCLGSACILCCDLSRPLPCPRSQILMALTEDNKLRVEEAMSVLRLVAPGIAPQVSAVGCTGVMAWAAPV